MSINNQTITATFDNSKFEKNIKTTIGSLSRFKSSISQMVGSSKTFQELGKTVDSVKVKFSSLQVIAVSTLENIANSAINTGKQLLKSLSVDRLSAGFEQYANIISATQTIASANADKSLGEINAQVERLSWFTDETSYNLQAMVGTIGKFTAAGRGLEDSVTTMIGFSNAAAEAGVNATEATSAMAQAAQTLGKGFFGLNDWREAFGNRGMDTQALRKAFIDAAVAAGTLKEKSDGVFQTLTKGKRATVTIDDMDKSLTDSKWLTTEVFEKAMATYGSVADDLYDVYNVIVEGKEDFEGNSTFTKEMVDSYIALADAEGEEIDTTSDLIRIIRKASTATEELREQNTAMLAGLDRFEKAQVAKTWEEVVEATKTAASTQWSKVFELIFGNLDEAKENFTGLANELWDVFAGPIAEFKDIVADWKANGGYDLLWSKDEENLGAVWNIVEALKSYVQVFTTAIEKIFGVVDGDKLIGWTEKFQSFTKSLILDENGINKWANTIKRVYSAFKNYYGFIKEVVNTISIAISGGGTSVRGVINTVAGTLSKAFGTGRKILSAFNKAFGAVMKQVKGAFKDVFGSGNGLFKTLVNIAQNFFGSIAKNKDLLSNIRTTLKGLFELAIRAKDLVLRIVDTIREVFNIPKKEGNPLVNILSKIFEWTAKIFGNVGESEGLDKFENGFIKFIRTAAEILKSVWELVKDLFKAGKNLFGQIFGTDSEEVDTHKSVGEFVKNIVESVRTFVNDLANNEGLINFFKGVVEFGGKVIEFFKELWDVLFDGRSVGEVLGDAFGWLGDTFGGLFGSVGDMYDAGEMTVKGFAEGIGNGIKWVVEVVKNIFNTVIGLIKTLFGIHSPADATMELGMYVGAGFGQGLASTVQDIKGRAAKLVSSVGEGFDGKMPAVLDKIKDFFAKVGDFFKRVYESFSEAKGSKVNLVDFAPGDFAGNLGKTIRSLLNFFESLTEFSLDVIMRGLTLIADVHAWLFDFIVKNDWAKAALLVIAGILAVSVAIGVAIKKIKNSIEWQIGYIDIVNNFSYMISSVGDYFWEMSKKAKSERFKIITEGIKDIGLALLMVVAAIGWLAKTIADMWEKNAGAVIASITIIGLLIGVLVYMTLQLNKTNRATEDFSRVGKMFSAKSKLKTTDNAVSRNVAVLGAFLLEFAGALLIMGKVVKDLLEAVNKIEFNADNPAEGIAKVSTVVILMVTMIGALASMTMLFTKEIMKDQSSTAKAISKNKLIKMVKNMVVIMLTMGAVTKMLKSAMKALVPVLAVSKNAEQIMSATGALLLLFSAIALLVVIMSKTFDKIDVIRLAGLTPLLLGITVLMSTLGMMLASVTSVVALTGNHGALWSSVGAIAALLGAMMGALALLSVFKPAQLLAGAAALTILSAGIATIAASLMSLVVVLSLIDPEQINPHGALWSVVGAIAALTLVLTGVLALLGKNEGIAAKVMGIGGAFALMGIGIVLATSSLMLLALTFKMFMNLAVEFKNTADSTITGFFEKAGLAMKTAINTFFDVIFQLRGRILQYVVMIITDLADAIRLSSPAIEKAVVETFLGLIRIGYQTIPALNELLIYALYDLLKTVLKHLPGLLEVGVEIGVVAFQALLDLLARTNLILIKAIIDFVIDAIPILVEGLGDAIDALAAQIPVLLYRLANAIYANGTKIFDAAKAVGDALTYTLMYGIGSSFNIGSLISAMFGGLVNGIMGKKDEANAAVADVAKSTKKTYKDEMGIASPSKVMTVLGEYTVDGLTKGIKKKQKDVSKSAIQMGENVESGYRKYMGISSPSTRMETDGIWTVKGVAKGISNKSASLDVSQSVTGLVKNIGSTFSGAVENVSSEMVDSATKAITNAQTKAVSNSFGPEYFWNMYGDTSWMNEKYMSEFIKQSELENANASKELLTIERSMSEERKRLEDAFKNIYSSIMDKYNAGVENGRLDPLILSQLKSFDMKNLHYLTDENLRYYSDALVAIKDSANWSQPWLLNKQINQMNDLVKQAKNPETTFGEKKVDNRTPVERIADLLEKTFSNTKALFKDMAEGLGLNTIGDRIAGGFKNLLGFGDDGNGGGFLDTIKEKIFGLSGNETMADLFNFDKLGFNTEGIVPEVPDYGDIMGNNGPAIDYDTASYAGASAGDATASSKGGWGVTTSNTDNSQQTNYFYVSNPDPDAVVSGVSRTLQRQAERKSREW